MLFFFLHLSSSAIKISRYFSDISLRGRKNVGSDVSVICTHQSYICSFFHDCYYLETMYVGFVHGISSRLSLCDPVMDLGAWPGCSPPPWTAGIGSSRPVWPVTCTSRLQELNHLPLRPLMWQVPFLQNIQWFYFILYFNFFQKILLI